MSDLVQIKQGLAQSEKAFAAKLNNKKEIVFAAECGFAMQVLESNNMIASAAQRNPKSLFSAVTNVAAIGLSLNPALKHAYLTPMGGEIVLSPSYVGLIYLATKSGSIKWAQAEVVREKDDFKMNGMGEMPTHSFSPFGDRGKMVGVYCVAKTLDGDFLSTTMSMEEIDTVKSCSKAQNGPWKKFFDQMALKSVVKRASKTWPAVSDTALLEAIHVSNETEGIDFEEQKAKDEQRRIEINEAAKIDYELISNLAIKITSLCGQLSQSMDVKGKIELMREVCKCDKDMSELSKKQPVELESILSELEILKSERE